MLCIMASSRRQGKRLSRFGPLFFVFSEIFGVIGLQYVRLDTGLFFTQGG